LQPLLDHACGPRPLPPENLVFRRDDPYHHCRGKPVVRLWWVRPSFLGSPRSERLEVSGACEWGAPDAGAIPVHLVAQNDRFADRLRGCRGW
jgi:hypothetical protein